MVGSTKGALQRSVKVQTLNMPWTIFKDALEEGGREGLHC